MRTCWMIGSLLVLGLCFITVPAGAQTEAEEAELTPEQRREQVLERARLRKAELEKQREAAQAEAATAFNEAVKVYMLGDAPAFDEKVKGLRLQTMLLDPKARKHLMEMDKTMKQVRPTWWEHTTSPSNITFKAEIWGRPFTANYMPSDMLGIQAVIPEGRITSSGQTIITGLKVIVSWRPTFVNKRDKAEGELAKKHGLEIGHLGEAIVWHELGHNYITVFLPVAHVVELYQNHNILFHHLQEFYADMAAIYHGSTKARLTAMLFRLDILDHYDEREPHTRAAHAIGSVLLADMLANPDKWPSVRFPPAVPAEQTELNTLIYIYENLDADWTIDEDFNLRNYVNTYIQRNGANILRSAGRLDLPNGQKMAIMAAQDRTFQAGRDKWVAEKLAKLIKDGRADKLAEGETYDPPKREVSQERFVSDARNKRKPPRVDLPW